MDFQTLKATFDRMCSFYKNKTEDCPFTTITGSDEWDDWYLFGAYEPEQFEQVVTEWVKEHPAPIYPTFLEFVTYLARKDNKGQLVNLPISELMNRRIPDAAAEELGLVPINECGLTKYVEEDIKQWY